MDKKIILGVIALVIVSISLLLLLPESPKDSPETLPWNIKHPTPLSSHVFGITLGEGTLADIEHVFKEQTEISLFKSPEGKMLVEAYFEELNLNGLKARFVLTIAVPAEKISAMYERGLRMNSTPSGKRITLTPDDLTAVRQTPVASITYLPSIRLDDAVFAKRFGEPSQKIRENKDGAIHWLYPQHGLDITLGGNEKPVFQYVQPKDFALLSAPLLAQGEVLK